MFKNQRIGMLVDDPLLRRELYLLKVKAGAAVYPADSESQLMHFILEINRDIAILSREDNQEIWPSLN